MKITTTIKLSDDLELEVKGFYTPEEPMIWTLPNGDPGYPGSESEFEINDIKITKGTLLDFIYATDGRQFVIDYLEELTIKQIEER